MQDYNEILEGAYVTYQDPKIMDAEVALEFNDGLIDEISKYKKDNEQELSRLRAAAIKKLKDSGVADEEAVKQAQEVVNAKILQHVEPYVMAHTSLYKDSFFKSPLTKRALTNAFGASYYQDLMEEYGYGQEDLPDGEMPMNTKSNLVSEAELTDEAKTILDNALGQKLMFRDKDKKYNDRYTRQQWSDMTPNQREARGMPRSDIKGLNFYFRDELDELLEAPKANLEIVKNSNSQTFKVRIKGRGTYTVTRQQIDQIPEGYFTGSSPAIIISEKITSNVLKRLR